jgi:Family of unknown function (DUF5939)
MSEAHPLFAVLCKSADADCATALERLVREAPDRRLNRINVLDFARCEGLNEQRAITTFLHATQIGLLDMSWNVLCPSCGGVLDANATLKTVRSNEYYCAFCAVSSEPTLDDVVEVSFTVSPRVRKIAAHNPDELPIWEYHRQIFWGTGVDLPDEKFEATCQQLTLDAVELPAGDKAILSLQLPAETQWPGLRGARRTARQEGVPLPRGPAAQDRHPRRSLPRGEPERAPGAVLVNQVAARFSLITRAR